MTRSSVRLLALGVPLVVALIAAMCWALVGRALRPVEVLRQRASEITAAGAQARLPVPATGDEIARLAETLNAMLERLADSARAQRQFVADASHELRSPVAAIRTVMEVAPRGTPPWEEARSDVLTESKRLGRLVDALLLLARRDAGTAGGDVDQRRPTSVAQVVAGELERPRRVPVTCDYRADPWVQVDHRSLTAAISNLLDNAGRHAATRVSVVVEATAGQAVVTVTDDGNGIPVDQRDRVFERFVRLDEARSRDAGGAGLGLAITRAVALDHGGTAEVVPSEQRGATLVLSLPLLLGPGRFSSG